MMQLDMTIFGLWIASWLAIEAVKFFAGNRSPQEVPPHTAETLGRVIQSLDHITITLERILDRLDKR